MGEALDELSDARPVSGLHGGPEEFTAVYDLYFHDVYRYVAGRVDVQVADDLAAETFLVAFRNRKKFDPERGSVRPWLFGVATNLVRRHRRSELRHYRALARAGAEPDADSHEGRVVAAVSAQALKPRLAKALTKLNQGERDVLLLLALGQLSHEEIAEALGVSYGTVGSRLSRGRAKLRDILEEK